MQGVEGGHKVSLRLKKNAEPHIFHCQDRTKDKNTHVTIKKRKLEVLEDTNITFTPAEAAANVLQVPEVIDHTVQVLPVTATTTKKCEHDITMLNKAVQVDIKPLKLHYRSKCVQVKPKDISVALSPFIRPSLDASTSPFKIEKIKRVLFHNTHTKDAISTTSASTIVSKSSDYEPEPETSTSEASWIADTGAVFRNKMRSGMLEAIHHEPKLLLGLPKKSYYLINLLTENIAAPTIDIMITLKKIKSNDSFDVLALHFGFSQSTVSRIFRKTIILLSTSLNDLITWPSPKEVISKLPIAFRARYSNVYSIIDCLEIEIEKPSNAIQQSLSWSQYKGCNTSKYLISCTPDGLITYISEGYGGRASDVAIVEDCGFLEKLPPSVAVMADRGFKSISHLLIKKNCTLIRPPSVSKTIASSKEEVNQSKRIAALRIHVERVIGRLREFNMLLPHSRIDNHLIPLLDHVIITACGIINMQDFLIKV